MLIIHIYFYLDDRYRDQRDGDRRRGGGSGEKSFGRYYEREDYNNRSSSRNADAEKDSRYPNAQMYFAQQQQHQQYATGGFDQYSYYQTQQYYENMRRTNPQAYAEFYQRYYGSMQQQQNTGLSVTDKSETGVTDGRESVHSGRSSANDKDR